MNLSARGILLSIIISVAYPGGMFAQRTNAQTGNAAKSPYGYLKPKQAALFAGYASARNKEAGTHQSPKEVYDALPESQRSTFEGVTHALMHSRLTDDRGRALGTALDLVAGLNEIAGERKGERGDRQFRLYVEMKPSTGEVLLAAREFVRDKDNSVFHKGYPINWRQNGRVPTIQISMARTGNLADIDVDYKSSKFPKGLVNGHLKAGNSDVRSGSNFFGHIRNWLGLIRWWRPLKDKEEKKVAAIEAKREAGGQEPPPSVSPLTPEHLAEAQLVAKEMNDFLTVWLLKRNPKAAVEYLTRDPGACVSIDEDEEDESIRGVKARLTFLRMLTLDVKREGVHGRLEDEVEPVEPWDSELVFVDHAYKHLFSLRGIQRDDAAEFHCDTSALPGNPDAYGEYFVTYVLLKCPSCGGISLLWTKEDGRWQIIAYDLLEN